MPVELTNRRKPWSSIKFANLLNHEGSNAKLITLTVQPMRTGVSGPRIQSSVALTSPSNPMLDTANPPPRLPMALAGALEHAAGMIARLDMALASHPLRPAWAWRARLDAIGRQAAVDGKAIDPWHLAALIEGVRLRLDHTPALIDRGILFAAAHHAFELYRWFAVPDETKRAAIGVAATISRLSAPRIRRYSARPSGSMPGSIKAASGRRCAPPSRYIGSGVG